MRHAWALLIFAGCHDPEAESLRARVAAQEKEIAALKARPAPETRTEPDFRDLERETDLLRKRIALLEKPALRPDAPILAVQGDSCFVLYSRPSELGTGDFVMDRRLTLSWYRIDRNSFDLVDVREIAPDLEVIQLKRPNGVSVMEVLKSLKDSKKK